MAKDTVTATHLDAGRRYLDALKALGFEPEGLLWGTKEEETQPRLLMITALVDRVGPLEIIETLYSAYEKACVPDEIDPWIVDLFSVNAVFSENLRGMKLADTGWVKGENGAGETVKYTGPAFTTINGYTTRGSWAYQLPKSATKPVEQLRHWKRFKRAVDIAA